MSLQDLINLNDCKFIFSQLTKAGGQSRFVGGCVRDAISGQPIKDIDIATTLLPLVVENIFSRYTSIKLINVGREHGTIMVVMRNHTYEITTLRQDIETDGRHAMVEYTTDWKADAARRDFTINAMSYSPEEDKLYDYFNGQTDAAAGVIKFVGSPEQRVQEDYLRIMRLFRFYTYCGRKIDEESLAACSQNASRLSSISKERKTFELLKIIEHDRCLETLKLMLQQNILKHLPFSVHWPQAIQRLAKLQNLANTCSYEVRACLRIFVLFNNFELLLPLSIKKYLKQLHNMAATADLKAIMALPSRYLYSFKDVLLDGLIYMLSTDGVAEAEARQIMEKFVTLQAITLPPFPLTGDDIMQRFSMPPGKELGRLIETAKQLWFESECSATRDNLLNQLEPGITLNKSFRAYGA